MNSRQLFLWPKFHSSILWTHLHGKQLILKRNKKRVIPSMVCTGSGLEVSKIIKWGKTLVYYLAWWNSLAFHALYRKRKPAVLNRAMAVRRKLTLALKCHSKVNLINMRTMRVEFSKTNFKSWLFSSSGDSLMICHIYSVY